MVDMVDQHKASYAVAPSKKNLSFFIQSVNKKYFLQRLYSHSFFKRVPKGTKYTGIYLSCLKIQFVAENRKRLAHCILVNDAKRPVRVCANLKFVFCSLALLLLASSCLLQLF